VNYTPMPWQSFRDKELWTMDVNDLLDANLENLDKIYRTHLTTTHKHMDLRDCITTCMHEAPIESVTEKDVGLAYGMSKMTVIGEMTGYKAYQKMEIVEWYEFVGRIADIKFNKDPTTKDWPLAKKIEEILDDLFTGY